MSFHNEKLYTIKSAWTDKYLYLEDDTLVAIGNAEVITYSNAYFYVLNVPDADWKGRFQFKPLNKPDLYIAVVNGELALKAANECKESERSFYYDDKREYYQYYVKENGTSYFLCCKNDGELYVSTQEVGDESLFELKLKEDEIIFAAEVEHLLFEELITEIVLNEE